MGRRQPTAARGHVSLRAAPGWGCRSVRKCAGLLVAVLMAGRLEAQAPLAGESADAPAEGLEEVVVSASRRLEDVQQVPISITALSAAQLEAKGVEQFFDYGIAVPNLSFGLGAADGSLAARGIALRGV